MLDPAEDDPIVQILKESTLNSVLNNVYQTKGVQPYPKLRVSTE